MHIGQANLPWLTLLLTGLAVVMFTTAGPAAPEWVYDRSGLEAGEYWRVFTGHWMHSGLEHLLWNLAGLGVLGSIVECHVGRAILVGSLLFGSLLVDLMLWLALPGMDYYCGLSGALNALLLPALYGLRQAMPAGLLLGIASASLLKIVLEQLAGHPFFTQAAWASVPLAHLAGWLAGMVVLLAGVVWVGKHGRGRPSILVFNYGRSGEQSRISCQRSRVARSPTRIGCW